ncbi:MAG TPA: glutamine amidotransferase, partial [Clostridium sp.]
MELNICHLYPDLLNVYGDVGNILILKNRAESRGIKVNVIDISLKNDFKSEYMDIIFFGGGQDYEQSIVSEDLKYNKKEELTKYIEDGKVLLAICGGYQLLGKYYRAPNGERLEGLGLLDIYTEGGDNRFIGNTVIYNEATDETYVGFENHSGRTYINDLKPLGKCIYGYGN